MFLPHPRVKVSIVGSFRDREVACSASDCQGSNFESCVWRTVSSQSSHHRQDVLRAQFSLYVHEGGLKPDSFHFLSVHTFHHTHILWFGLGYPWMKAHKPLCQTMNLYVANKFIPATPPLLRNCVICVRYLTVSMKWPQTYCLRLALFPFNREVDIMTHYECVKSLAKQKLDC